MNTKFIRIILLNLLLLGSALKLSAQFSNVPVTGFNADVVADGVGSVASSTSVTLDNTQWTLAASDWNFTGSCPAISFFMPVSGTVNANATVASGLVYSLQPYTAFNDLRVPATGSGTTGTGTLTVTTPVSMSTVYLLCTAGNGPITNGINITITFTDASTQVFSNLTALDWYNTTNPAISNLGRVDRNLTPACATTVTGGPQLFDMALALNPSNYNKLVQSITIDKTVTAGTFNVFAVGMMAPCSLPIDQPTTPLLTAISTSQIDGSFTAAASAPSGYLVVRYPASSVVTLPVNGTTYIANQSLGLGKVIQSSATTTFSSTGLNGSTSYDFYIYSYNTGASCGGPIYRTASALMGTQTTTTCTSAMAGTVAVGPGLPNTPAGGFSTLTDALTYINANGLSASAVLELQSGYTTAYAAANETYPLTFPVNPCISSTNNLTIRPAAGVGSNILLTSNNAIATMILNGAANITIDGRAGGIGTASFLTIENTNLAGAAVQFINDASNNTIQYCTVQSVENTASNGTIVFSTGIITGNDNNIIDNCSIKDAATTPVNGIYSLGSSAAIDNSGNTISNCNISNYYHATVATSGIMLTATGNSGWSILNNKLFQTANRFYTTANTHNGIAVLSGSGYTISGNTLGFANAAGTGTTNMMGNTVALSGFPAAYTATGTANATRYIALNCAFTAGGATSTIQNNTIGGYALYTSSGAATTNGIFCGINLTSGNGTITGNTIGAATGNGSIYTVCTSTGGAMVGIYSTSANTVSILNNNIGAVDAMGNGLTSAGTVSGAFTGIDAAGAGNYTISGNMIGNTSANNIRTGNLTNAGATALSNVGTNFLQATANGAMIGIRSSVTGNSLSITLNTIKGLATAGTSSAITGITSSGTMSGANPSANISNNFLGTASSNWITYTVANSGTLTGISLTNTIATNHTIQNNDIRGITNTVAGTGAHTYINLAGATAANNIATISGNTFTNLNVNTTGTVQFIVQSYTGAATSVKNNTNNAIVTAYNRAGGSGAVTLILDNGSSVTGCVSNCTNNNFSNITLSGTSTLTGISFTDGGTAPTRTVSGNTLTNWTVGTGTVNAMNVTYWNGNSSLSTNTVNNINGQGSITGITIGASANTATLALISSNTITNLSSTGTGGNVTGITCSNTSPAVNITNNTINTLSSTGASSTVTGIAITGATATSVFSNIINGLSGSGATSPITNGVSVSGGTLVNVYKNKIYNLQQTAAITTTQGAVNGILLSGGTTVNTYNNLIGDLKAPTANLTDAIRGISVTSSAAATFNVSYNTVNLNASSTGVNFGTSGIFHTANATATNGTLNLQNNIISNKSSFAGTGLTVAFRQSAGTAGLLANYASTSNNNIFYAGTPSASNLIYSDGVSSAQTINDYKNGVFTAGTIAPRESSSNSENINFLSTTGSSVDFLHIDPAISTLAESGGTVIAGISDDFDGNTRNASTPDVGADEFIGITPAPSITNILTVPSATQCTATARTVTVNVSSPGSAITSVTLNYNNGSAGSGAMTLSSGTTSNGVWTGIIPAALPVNADVTWSISATDGTYTTTINGAGYSDDPLFDFTATAFASPSVVCLGSSTNLTAAFNGTANIAIGNGTSLTSATSDVTAFGNRWPSFRMQLLYTATELSAAGLSAGPITAMTFNISTLGDGATNSSYTVQMGTTGLSALTGYVSTTGFTTVFPAATYTHAVGFNTINFSTPYNWDGTSNIAIDITYNGADITNNARTYYTTTTANTVAAANSGGTAVVSNTRPNVIFTGNTAPSITAYSWTDGSTIVGTVNPLSVSPTANTTYTATITALGCSKTTNPVTINVNPVPSAPSATNSSQCGTAIPTASVTSTAGVNGSGTFLWYSAATGGTLLQGPALSNTLSNYYTNDFSSAILTMSSLSGAAAIGSNILTLQPTAVSQQGGFTVNESGVNSTQYQTDFDLTLASNGATMADGFSYSFGDDASATTTTPTAEHGSGSKLRIGFFTYNTANTADGKGIYLMYNPTATSGYTSATPGVLAYSTDVSWIPTSATSLSSHITCSINATGQLNLSVGGTPIFTNVQLPAAFLTSDKSTWKHVFSSRSGGTAGGYSIDNLAIQTNAVVPGYATYQTPVNATTTFYVAEKGLSGCESSRTPVTVTVSIPDGVTASSPTTPVCANSPVSLVATKAGTTNTYIYSWTASPSTGSGIAGSPVSGQTVSVTPTAAGTYIYTVTAIDATLGCTTTSTVSVTVNTIPTAPVITPSSATICLGGIQPLTVATSLAYNFGTQATQNTATNTITDYPAPYTLYWGGQRMQMLITAAELTAAGFSPGSDITSIQFPVVSLGSNWGTTTTALQGFQVSIGATSLTSLSAFQTGLTQVIAPANFTPVVGLNTNTFATPFTWNGTSNLILETTFSNNITGSTNDLVTQYNSPTAYQSTIVFRADNTTAAAVASTATVSYSYNARPDFKLNGSSLAPVWSGTGLFTDALAQNPYTGSAIGSVYASPANTTIYTATVTNGVGCINTAMDTVNVNIPSVEASASVVTTCSGSPFDLTASLVNTNFNGATNNWTTINNSTGGTSANAAWTLHTSPYIYSSTTFNSNDVSQFYMSNSDAQGNGGTTETILKSAVINTNGMTSMNLEFNHYFRAISGDHARVEVSIDGVNWTQVQDFTTTQGAASAFAPVSINLDAYTGNATMYVRFRYNAAYGWYWAIDNVKIAGNSTNTFAWTSTPVGFTAATQNPSGVTATGSTTYTVTATNAGCSSTSSVDVNITPSITGNTINTDQILCSGSAPAPFSGGVLSGGTGTYSYLWQSSTASATSGFAAAAGVNNTAGYSATALTQTTWYRRVVISGTCSDTSNAIEMTVTPGIVNNTISSNQTVCSGFTPAQILGTTPTGAGGTYNYMWLSSTSNGVSGFAGASGVNTNIDYTPAALSATTWFRRVVNSGSCTDTSVAVVVTVSQPVTGNTISASQVLCSGAATVPLTGSITGIFEDFNGLTGSAAITTASLSSGWTVSQNQGGLVIGSNVNSYGRVVPNGTLKSNNYSVSDGNIARIETKVFGPTIAGDSLRFDVAAANYSLSVQTDTLRVLADNGSGYTLLKQYLNGNVIDTSVDGITTSNAISGSFTPSATQWANKKLALPVGTMQVRFEFASGWGNNIYVDRVQVDSAMFTWLSSITSASTGFVAAAGTNNNSGYAPGILTQSTWYKRVANNGGACASDTSAAVAITVNPGIAVNTISSDQNICNGNAPETLMGSAPTGGDGSYTYLWESSITSATTGFSAATVPNNTINYAPGALTQSTWYRRTVNSGTCASNTSSAVKMDVSSMSSILAPSSTSDTYVQNDGNTNIYTDASCSPILKISDNAGGNTLGSVTATVTVDGSVQFTNGQPYLQRHYLITVANNAGVSATVTLYATQSEFNTYNLSAGSYPLLPTGGIDNGNIRVTKFTGDLPTPGIGTLINPTVLWNATNSWWEISFPVTSFSSFYIHTGTLGPLDIELRDISAVNIGSRNRVDWNTVSETNADKFELERSTDGNNFSYLESVKAKGQSSVYSYWDENPVNGINYYRLKMINKAGIYHYSKTVSATVKTTGSFTVEAFPNPVDEDLTVKINGIMGNNASILLTDMTGKLIRKMKVENAQTFIDMKSLASGMYFIKYIDDDHSQTIKVNKR